MSCRAISSDASSSISVVSVPFDVTGDGPTKSLGLINCMPLGESPSSIAAIDAIDDIDDIDAIADLGRSDEDSAELRVDLSHNIVSTKRKNFGAIKILTTTGTAGNWWLTESLVTWRSRYRERSST